MHVFITGASGWIGSALVPELLAAGHRVTGLARSDASAQALTAAGADVLRGSLDDLDVLRAGAQQADGVVHLAFKHDLAFTGQGAQAASADREAVQAFVDALAGTDKPLVIASGALGVTPGRVGHRGRRPHRRGRPAGRAARHHTAQLTLEARRPRGALGRRPAVPDRARRGRHRVHRRPWSPPPAPPGRRPTWTRAPTGGPPSTAPTPPLFRLAVEQAPAGSVLHAVAEEGVAHPGDRRGHRPGAGPAGDLAAGRGRRGPLRLPRAVLGLDSPTSSNRTRALLGWTPTHPTLVEDIDAGRYTR